ncbi:MAG: VanW family protein [Bowdeniella nasicola]|nr:VanW family protein [Bowdeniella nasicola]
MQDNKAVNRGLAIPHVNRILIRPGEVFSFWKLVGPCSAKRSYQEGLIVGRAVKTRSGVGGGMCQFTNLIHWMILHSELDVIEHHHHDRIDMFPDFGRKVPFGTGTSIMYNYLGYRVKNNTDKTFQLIIYTDDEYLYGEVRASALSDYKIHIGVEDEHFVRIGVVYRKGKVYARRIDKRTGDEVERTLIRSNHAKVLYDTSNLTVREG